VLDMGFQIIVNYTKVTLSDIPTALRGSLNGSGDLEAQISIRVPGPMNKATAEGLCESLPGLSGSTYAARFKVRKKEIDHEGE